MIFISLFLWVTFQFLLLALSEGNFFIVGAEEKALMYEKKLAIYEEIIKKCEASKAGVTSACNY
jgi:hypothetical protein